MMKEKLHGIVSQMRDTSGYGGAIVTMTGDSEVLVEGNRGIIAYDDCCVLLRAGQGQLQIEGSGLLLRSMEGENLCVTGKIVGVSWIC